ncbi:MAG: hypothetical protein OEY59_00280 [Deltaproteobacteria bacterium]|nr:hypothetical protein [Deltaproteobacteria bacterium]
MVKTLKFDLQLRDSFELSMPKGAEILSLEFYDQTPQLHVLIEPGVEVESRKFRFAVAGELIQEDKNNLWYLGSFQIAPKNPVYHLFEITGQVQ